MPGALVSARGESRYGDTINRDARLALPANTDLQFPLSDERDIAFTLTELTYTQFLTGTFALFAGKLNTFGGDPNEFAQGRGKDQFGNADLVFNPVTAVTVPYSTLGLGALWAPSPNFVLSGTVMNTTDSSTTTGFDDIGDGWTASFEAQTQYMLGDQPGGQNIGFTYAFDGSFTDITGRLSLESGVGLRRPSTDESYAVYWSGWRYLWSVANDQSPINTLDGIPDRKGIGLFARAGYGDDDTSLFEWHVSGGIGGRGLIEGRENDHFGVGYSFSHVNPSRLTSVVLSAIPFEDETQSFEAFYNAELTPAARLTLSVQAIDDIGPRTDTAVVLGLRLSVRF